MPKIAGLRVPSDAAKQVATIDQLMHQAQKLKAEVARLEGERDALQARVDEVNTILNSLEGSMAFECKEFGCQRDSLQLERDAARKAARAWKRAAKVKRQAFNSTCKALDDLKMNYAVLTMQTGAK